MKYVAILDYIKIIRPANAFMVTSMVLAGIWFSNPSTSWYFYLLASIVPISYIGIAMVHNDIIDLKIDQINAPQRPLPSGRISMRQAKIYILVLFFVGTIAGIWQRYEAIIIMVLTLILSLAYNAKLKKIGFLGNLTVGITATSAFLYGDAVISGWEHFWPVSRWGPAVYLFLISALLNTSREVSKGIMDVSGDQKYGVKTIAVRYGKSYAAKMVLIIVVLALLVGILPLVNGTFGYVFIIAILAFALLLVNTVVPLVKVPNYENAKRFKRNLLPNMFIALVLVILDVIIQKYTSLSST